MSSASQDSELYWPRRGCSRAAACRRPPSAAVVTGLRPSRLIPPSSPDDEFIVVWFKHLMRKMSNSNKTEDKTPEANVTLSKMMMYSAIQQPEPLAEVRNLAVNWREWKSAFEYYLIASGKDVAPDREKALCFYMSLASLVERCLKKWSYRMNKK
ncbi:hypothetical protein ACJJTC_002112 [Scirpophaga incertulas]